MCYKSTIKIYFEVFFRLFIIFSGDKIEGSIVSKCFFFPFICWLKNYY